MGVIYKELELAGDRSRGRYRVLFDSGASMSLVRRGVAERLATVLPTRVGYRFETAEPGRFIEARYAVRLEFRLDGEWLSDEFLVLEDDQLSEDVIIGAKTMQAWRLVLDMEKEEVYSVRSVKKHILKRAVC